MHLYCSTAMVAVMLASTQAVAQSVNNDATTPETNSAQTTPPPLNASDPEATDLDDIVVTAQKRGQNLQDVPLAVTALSGTALTEGGVQNTADLQFQTPSLVVTTNGAFGQPFLRGVGTDILGIGTESSVAINIDGVYIARPTSAIQDFYDVDRVEVVKGPQGILYGRNATGGAINIITNVPTFEFGGSAEFTYGNYNKTRAVGVLNIPLGDDVAIRASVVRSTRDGFTKRVFDPTRPTQLDNENVYGGRLQLRFKPGADWDVNVGADYFKQDDAAFLHNRPIARAEYVAAGLPLEDTFVDRTTGAVSAIQLPGTSRRAGAISRTPAESFSGVVPADIRRLTQDIEPYNSVEDYGARATISYSGDAFGFRSITSYRENKYEARQDFDGTNAVYFFDREGTDSKVFTQELQLTSPSGSAFDWIVGAYYFNEKGRSFFDYNFGAAALGLATGGYVNAGLPQGSVKTDAAALFGQATYEFAQGLSATVGLRYSYEKKSNFRLTNPGAPNAPTCDARALPSSERSCSDSFSVVTPKFGVQYDFGTNKLLYASVTRGFKSGGFNSNGDGESFDPEFIWSYEAGIKADWFNRRFRTNIAAFYYDYSDLQVRLRDPLIGAGQIVSNAAQAKIYGVELDTQTVIAEGLTLDFSAAYLNAQFRNYTSANQDEDPSAVLDLSGNRLPRAPEWTLSGGVTYVAKVSSGDITFSGDWRYSSRFFFDVFNQPFVQQPSYSLFNARIQYNNEANRFFVAGFVRNIGDKQYRTSVIRSDSVVGTLEFYGAPRTYGVQMGVRF